MPHATVFDCEYLTAPGAMSRYWAGPGDPDPVVVQIGAVNLSLDDGFEILGSEQILIQPVDRIGEKPALDPFFTELTGISQAQIDADGVPHAEALTRFERFSDGGPLWSWGKDELNLLGISCYIAGITPTLPAARFGNAKSLLLKAGMPVEDVARTTSGTLAAHFGFQQDARKHHDAVDDAMSIALSLQHLMRTGKLMPSDVSTINRESPALMESP